LASEEYKIKLFEAGFDNGLALEWHSEFLNEGDFETFQPVTTLNRHSKEFLKAHLIIKKELVRALWLQNRLTEYLGPEWQILNEKIQDETRKYYYLKTSLERWQNGI